MCYNWIECPRKSSDGIYFKKCCKMTLKIFLHALLFRCLIYHIFIYIQIWSRSRLFYDINLVEYLDLVLIAFTIMHELLSSGNTLGLIAGEKAGIFKVGEISHLTILCPLVKQHHPVLGFSYHVLFICFLPHLCLCLK